MAITAHFCILTGRLEQLTIGGHGSSMSDPKMDEIQVNLDVPKITGFTCSAHLMKTMSGSITDLIWISGSGWDNLSYSWKHVYNFVRA